jgi:hypothetical protein
MENQYFILFLAFISFLLIVSIFKWMNYLSLNNYIVECFQQLNYPNVLNQSNQSNQSNDTNLNNSTSHTVDLPLTTTTSCSNFCGPTSRCAKTGQQCFVDMDCPGCQPQTSNQSKNTNKTNIVGDNDAGKLTFSVTPQYSTLTTDIGTRAMTFLDKDFSKTPSPTFGINTWRASFDAEQKLFDKRYKPPNLKNMPSYPQRYSVTGDFLDDGPLASNATI